MIAPERHLEAHRAALDDLRGRMELRVRAGAAYVERHGAGMAACAAEMADRFWDGATLLIIGSGAAATDAQHNAVEYVHPVLPGCRALPALAVSPDASSTGDGGWERPVRLLARPRDILLAFADTGDAAAAGALRTARARGVLTIAVVSGADGAGFDAHHLLDTGTADPLVAQELQLATYHVLWELVHIILNHRGSAAQEPPP